VAQALITAPTVYEAVSRAAGRWSTELDRSEEQVTVSWAALRDRGFFQLRSATTRQFNLMHQLSSGRALFVGEGNLSFSLAIARGRSIRASELVATTFEAERNVSALGLRNARSLRQLGATVAHGVDATKLERYFTAQRFSTVFFGFPNVASRVPIYGHNPNHNLARQFLRSAKGRLASAGRVVITLVASPFYEGAFNLSEAARFAGLKEPEVFEFAPNRISGYSHTNTLGNGSALRKYEKFKLWVFQA
jgi:hypothetical protein